MGGVARQHDHLPPSDAVAKLQAAAWSLDPSDAGAVIRAACDALVLGADTLSLGMLAAMSINELNGSGHEIAEVLEATFEELGLPYLPPGSIAGREAAVRAMAEILSRPVGLIYSAWDFAR